MFSRNANNYPNSELLLKYLTPIPARTVPPDGEHHPRRPQLGTHPPALVSRLFPAPGAGPSSQRRLPDRKGRPGSSGTFSYRKWPRRARARGEGPVFPDPEALRLAPGKELRTPGGGGGEPFEGSENSVI